ncbi:helix-turn-helix transcriptional regulator [Thiothrix fructosivorans]|uniref:Helix-turn-helix domain-containing protein n=1 Tax=Thiothrix fructosivorans TaxID=111770 RepID=A0A8B0SI01_9GAMM|nr:hypothetical protein [Thiothrix fructosivorans]MBO0611696.1 hypothetical protein [Thiothrix fructosivorans]QTX10644.1 hypothetical protein J1836_019100 [Thiothrix fructosivorans]
MSKLIQTRRKLIERQLLASTFPIDGRVTAKQVGAFLGVSKSKLYLMVRDGELPSPTKIGLSSYWSADFIRGLVSEIEELTV